MNQKRGKIVDIPLLLTTQQITYRSVHHLVPREVELVAAYTNKGMGKDADKGHKMLGNRLRGKTSLIWIFPGCYQHVVDHQRCVKL